MRKLRDDATTVKSRPGRADRPRLTISIVTRDSEDRLERLLAEASWLADQIVVGVDAASTDRTLEIASRLADQVFTFSQNGSMAAARMMVFDYALGDWILVLDDDESLEPGFADLLPELMSREGATHYWFPRKWIVNAEPYEFVDTPPWYPDWQMRLFHNDRSLVWKPARPHTGYQVLGPGYFESRASILHFEPIWCSPDSRRAKLARYRAAGAEAETEAQYPFRIDSPRRPALGPATVEPKARSGGATVHPEVRDGTEPRAPAWGMAVLEVEMPATTRRGATLVAKVRVRNTGELAWTPNFGARGATLGLGVHLRDGGGTLIRWDYGGRTPMRDTVPPGGETAFLHVFHAPDTPGDYLLDWNMVDEGEAWFGGAQVRAPTHTPLTVTRSRQEADRLFLDQITDRIPGWLNDGAALRTIDLLRWQTERGLRGPVFEIGVYAGRYLAVLAREALAAGDAAVGLDTFERVDEATVRAHLTEAGLPGEAVGLARCRSDEQSPADLLALLGAPARFVSIDGSHLRDDVLQDLVVSDAILADEGIIACDDFLNPDRLGVGEAIHAYLARADDLAPFAYVQNKLFLCRGAAQPALLAAMLAFCAEGEAIAGDAHAASGRNLTRLHGWDVMTAP
jgi:hypothetical protein